ncbi:MAG: hypothetical protein K0R62_6323 [Nonomuraea muscovyensis]|jgi:hypothetical protein|nr:hypothetical protein [Nonomuraea muscovyensis]
MTADAYALAVLTGTLALAVGWSLGYWHRARTADRRTALAAERAARAQDWQDQDRAVLEDWDSWLCCVPGFTSRGAEHDAAHCTRKGQTT